MLVLSWFKASLNVHLVSPLISRMSKIRFAFVLEMIKCEFEGMEVNAAGLTNGPGKPSGI